MENKQIDLKKTLGNAFIELSKLDGTKKVDIPSILKSNHVRNVMQMSAHISRTYLIKPHIDKMGYWKWNPNMLIPQNLKIVMDGVAKYYSSAKQKNSDVKTTVSKKEKTPGKSKRPIILTDSHLDNLQTIFELLKGCTNFTKVKLEDLVRKSKVPYYSVVGTVIRNDYLERGDKSSMYRWKDQSVEIPNLIEFITKARNYYGALSSNQKMVKTKKTPSVPPANKSGQINKHLTTIIDMLHVASPAEAETLINNNDMFDGNTKKELRRMYHDGSIGKYSTSDIVTSLTSSQPITTDIAVIDTTPSSLEKKIEMAIKHTILQHYRKEMEALQATTMKNAKQHGIVLTEQEIRETVLLP